MNGPFRHSKDSTAYQLEVIRRTAVEGELEEERALRVELEAQLTRAHAACVRLARRLGACVAR